MPEPRLAIVRWEDTTNIAAWSTPEEVVEFARDGAWVSENVGWVVADNDDCIVLAARRTVDMAHVGLYERITPRAVLDVHASALSAACSGPGPSGASRKRPHDSDEW